MFVNARGQGKDGRVGRASVHRRLIKWSLCAFRPVFQPQALTGTGPGSIQLPACQEDTHTLPCLRR